MRIKFVVFDFDGTLTEVRARSAWYLIDHALGCEEADKDITERHTSGKTSVAEWSRETVEMYKKFGLDRDRLNEIMAAGVKLMPGSVETIESLKRMGIRTAIVSGSIANIYHYLRDKHGLETDKASFATEIFFGPDGRITGGKYNDYDFEGKVRIIETFCKELGVKLEETAMVGDSDNDVFAFRKVGLPIAFNPASPELEKAAKHVVRSNDLRDVLDFVL
jgi:phosphoserine phosphatase